MSNALTTADLQKYNFVIAIDKSGSMETADTAGGKSRFESAKEYATSIAMKCEKYDTDGIDVILFNNSAKLYQNVTSDKVEQIFKENSPMGGTATDEALNVAFGLQKEKASNGDNKPMILVVFTDGEPNDRNAVVSAIVNKTKEMTSDDELGISFVQIGADSGARKFLEYLDDNLVNLGAAFDIVDCKDEKELESLSIDDLLLQAIND